MNVSRLGSRLEHLRPARKLGQRYFGSELFAMRRYKQCDQPAKAACGGNQRKRVSLAPRAAGSAQVQTFVLAFMARHLEDVAVQKIGKTDSDESRPDYVRSEMTPGCHAADTERCAEYNTDKNSGRCQPRPLTPEDPPAKCVEKTDRAVAAGK